MVTSPAAGHHHPLNGVSLYFSVTEAHVCEQLAQGYYLQSGTVETRTRDLLSRKFSDLTIMPPGHTPPLCACNMSWVEISVRRWHAKSFIPHHYVVLVDCSRWLIDLSPAINRLKYFYSHLYCSACPLTSSQQNRTELTSARFSGILKPGYPNGYWSGYPGTRVPVSVVALCWFVECCDDISL